MEEKLYLSDTDKKIGGVCEGFHFVPGALYPVDPVFLRGCHPRLPGHVAGDPEASAALRALYPMNP